MRYYYIEYASKGMGTWFTYPSSIRQTLKEAFDEINRIMKTSLWSDGYRYRVVEVNEFVDVKSEIPFDLNKKTVVSTYHYELRIK